jgi:DNA-binding NarL/FixJ family response regulator
VTTSSSSITILIVDDHALVRMALGDRLEQAPGLTVVGLAEDAGIAIRLAAQHQPDIILMDIDMPGVVCFDAAMEIRVRSPETHIIFLSAFFNDRYIESALAVEAAGYITKSEPPRTVITAIRAVMAGGVYFSPEVRSRIVVDADGAKLSSEPRSRASTLTPREVEVLRYVARGLSRKEIAATLDLSLKTVECHCSNLMTKLRIHDRVELARFAIREGLVEP